MVRVVPFTPALLLLGPLLTGCSFFRPVPASVPIEHESAQQGALLVGAATVDITPSESMWMGGHGILRTSTGVHDPLSARAIVIRRDAVELALVALDLVGIQRQEILRFHETISGDPRRIVIASTHTHSGPDTLGMWGFPPFVSGLDRTYQAWLATRIDEALCRARADLRPAEIGYGAMAVEARGFIKNLRRPGLVDRDVVVLHAREAGGGPTIATLVELGCHPEALGEENTLLSADYPHWARRRLEERLGGICVYVSGDLGAMVTPDVERREPVDPDHEWREAERIGLRLADHALDVVSSIEAYDAAPRIALWHSPLYVVNRNFDYEVARWFGIIQRDRYRWGYFLTEVNLWEIGALRIATVPGEIAPGLGLAIKRAVGGAPTMLVGLANDELGYLLPSSEFDHPIYGYERSLSPGYDAGDHIAERLAELARLADQARGERKRQKENRSPVISIGP